MRTQIRHTLIPALFACLLILGGCRKDVAEPYGPDGKTGKVVTVSLKVSLPPVTSPITSLKAEARRIPQKNSGSPAFTVALEPQREKPSTRASDGTTELYNLWLFQFNADGSINGLPHKITDKVNIINDMVVIDVPLVVAENQTIYLLALGSKIEKDLSPLSSLSELESQEFGYISNQQGHTVSLITADEQIPFAGKVSGVTVTSIENGERGLVEYNKPDGFSGGIEIRRLMAHVTLRYKFEVSGYKLQGMKLINANSVIRLKNPDTNPDTDTYIELESDLPETPDADGFYTISWYVAQNCHGTIPSILSESDRYHKVVDNIATGQAPALGTQIEAWAYSTTKTDEFAIYQMYVGNNNTNNFDVEANSVYNLRTYINTDIGTTQKDERIRAYAASQYVYLNSTSCNPPLNKNPYTKGTIGCDFDAHFETRPITLKASGRMVTIGIYSDADCTLPVSPEDSWLRISSSSNYTEAVNNIAEPLRTSVETKILLPSKLMFYLYSDEYIYDGAGQIPDPAAKRTLYVKIATTSEGITEGAVKSYSTIYEMSQQPAVYVGMFGGEKQADGYTKGLVYDRVNESSFEYLEEPLGKRSYLSPGYNRVNTIDAYGTDSYDNGKTATVNLSENPNGLAMGVDNIAVPEKDASGHVMLYQYNYYNGFAARFCYDRNRDENGNGVLDPNELKWYLPAANQLLGMMISENLSEVSSSSTWSTTETSATMFLYYNLSGMDTQSKANSQRVRCVREIDPPTR